MSKSMMRLGAVVAVVGIVACGVANAQVVKNSDTATIFNVNTGQPVATLRAESGGTPINSTPVTIYSAQSPQGSSSNVTSEAAVYLNPDREPITYSLFRNYNSTTGALFPGVFLADDMGLGAGFTGGVDEISSYTALLYRSSLDIQPGLADIHIELWDGDPFCSFDTPATGFACAPIAGSESDIVDIPAGVQFTSVSVLPKGVVAPNTRVWMVISGSETGVNPSPCRLGWDIAYGPGVIGGAQQYNPDLFGAGYGIFLLQDDENNGADSISALGVCCSDGADCDASTPCTGDTATGARGFCFDDFAETPGAGYFSPTGSTCQAHAGTNCSNFVASIFAPATSIISLVEAGTGSDTITVNSAPADMEAEIHFSNWDSGGSGTLLKAWQANIESSGYYSGFQGYLTPTTTACSTNLDCRTAYGAYCEFTGTPCLNNAPSPPTPAGPDDCGIPTERCLGPKCAFPTMGPNANTQCEPGFIFTTRTDYVFKAADDLPAVDLSTLDYRYASADQGPGVGVPTPFPAQGVYAGTLRLTASPDCKGTFTVGFQPPPNSVLVDANNLFIPLVGFAPLTVDCVISRCCIDLTGAGGCWDNVTADQCAGGPGTTYFDTDRTKTCDDDCIQCLDDSFCQDGLGCNGHEVCNLNTFLCEPGTPLDCDDSVGCTDDACVEDGADAAHCENVTNDANCDDGDFCNGLETCDATNDCQAGTPTDPDDGDPCTADTCDPATGTVTNLDMADATCDPAGDGTDCPVGDNGIQVATGCSDAGVCECVLCPDLVARTSAVCAQNGSKVNVDVVKTPSPNVTAIAFNLDWDTSCMSYNGITPSADWPFELELNVGNGTLYAAYGIDPFSGGVGTGIEAVVASISFTKIGDCNACDVCVTAGTNPYDTLVSFYDQNAQGCVPNLGCTDLVTDTDNVSVTCPGDQATNADCDFPTAIVNWDAPTCSSDCGSCDLDCHGVGPNGENLDALAMGGGEHPIGTSTYTCTATGTGSCSGDDTCSWTVTVNDTQAMDVTLQLSPILSGDLQRCIKFELYSDCVQAPLIMEQNLYFGGAYDHIGHFTDSIKVPVGQFACITARDQQHSLRSCAYPDCVDGVYEVTFKGDPFFGGNWLVQGNLDGWKKDNPLASQDVIDILDFGAFVANYLNTGDPNSACGTDGTHADINGDGIVDDLDFAFISMNFLASSKDCCCGPATAAVIEPTLAVSVKELRQTGNADLAAADLNHDGMVDTDDVTAFLQGERPSNVKPKVRVRAGSGLRR